MKAGKGEKNSPSQRKIPRIRTEEAGRRKTQGKN
jgi:hypothetical protein